MRDSEFEKRRSAARGYDGKRTGAGGQHRATGSLDGGGRIAVPGKMREEHVAPARPGSGFEELARRRVGEMAVSPADALLGGPRAPGVGLEHLRAVVGLDVEHIDFADVLADVGRRVSEVGQPGEAAAW